MGGVFADRYANSYHAQNEHDLCIIQVYNYAISSVVLGCEWGGGGGGESKAPNAL
jgi:hypothetical protein